MYAYVYVYVYVLPGLDLLRAELGVLLKMTLETFQQIGLFHVLQPLPGRGPHNAACRSEGGAATTAF